MDELSHYRDEDFQSYLDNNFTGDVRSLESHVQECELCNKNLNAYSSVWAFIKNDLKTDPLRIDLASLVADKVFSAKETRYIFEAAMYGIFICLGIICLFLGFKFLFSFSIPSYFILVLIPVGLSLWIDYKEIKMVQKKFSSSL